MAEFPVTALLFDSDGVLVDSLDAAAVAWNEWGTRWKPGFDFHRDVEHGRRVAEFVAELVGPEDADEATAALAALERDHAVDVREIPGAAGLLASLPAGRWAVVTSGTRDIATARLAAAGLPTPAVLVTADDVTAGETLAGVMFYYENARDGEFISTSAVLVLTGLMVFIAAHAFGQGSVIWVFISEIFPNRIRGRGQSLGSLTHWVFAAITSFAFPPIIGAFGAGAAFSIFFVAMVGQLVWVLKVMPETKGVPLGEMEVQLGLTHEPGPGDPLAARGH